MPKLRTITITSQKVTNRKHKGYTMAAEIEHRITEMEHVLTKLTTIQEQQTKQTDKIISSVDKFSAMTILVEQNTHDINILNDKIAQMRELMHVERKSLDSKIYQKSFEADKAGQARLWKGLSTAVLVTIFAFGYLYTDIKTILKTKEIVVSHQTEMRSDIRHIADTLLKIVKDHNACEERLRKQYENINVKQVR